MDQNRRSSGGDSEALSGIAMAGVAIVAVALMAVLMAIAARSGLDVDEVLSDPQEFTRQRFLGAVSTVGVLGWAAAASICAFGAYTVDASERSVRGWLLSSAGVSLLLLVDDLFLVHEYADDVVATVVDFDRTRSQKDILEAIVFAGYAVVFVGTLVAFRRVVATLDLRLLGLSVGLFAVSAGLDLSIDERIGFEVIDDDLDLHIVLEEGLKFLGIAFYLVFHATSARTMIRRG